jgi:hypothetical protein
MEHAQGNGGYGSVTDRHRSGDGRILTSDGSEDEDVAVLLPMRSLRSASNGSADHDRTVTAFSLTRRLTEWPRKARRSPLVLCCALHVVARVWAAVLRRLPANAALAAAEPLTTVAVELSVNWVLFACCFVVEQVLLSYWQQIERQARSTASQSLGELCYMVAMLSSLYVVAVLAVLGHWHHWLWLLCVGYFALVPCCEWYRNSGGSGSSGGGVDRRRRSGGGDGDGGDGRPLLPLGAFCAIAVLAVAERLLHRTGKGAGNAASAAEAGTGNQVEDIVHVMRQASVPITLGLSHTLLGRRYPWKQLLGGALAFVGVALSAAPHLHLASQPLALPQGSTKARAAVLACAGAVLGSAVLVLEERAFERHRRLALQGKTAASSSHSQGYQAEVRRGSAGGAQDSSPLRGVGGDGTNSMLGGGAVVKPLSLPVFGFWKYTLCLGAFAVAVLAHVVAGKASISGVRSVLHSAMHCALDSSSSSSSSSNSSSGGGDGGGGDAVTCGRVSFAMFTVGFLSFCANFSALGIIKLGSANLAIFVWALTFPLEDVCYALFGETTVVLGANVAVGLLCICAGLLAFGKHPH